MSLLWGDVLADQGPPGVPVKDLPHGSLGLRLWVCKRRFVCTEKLCARGSFTEVSDQIPAWSRLTERLRKKVSAAVTTTNRAMSEVAGEYGVAWWTVHRILVASAVKVLGQAAPTTMIGIDETRAVACGGSVRRAGGCVATRG